MKPRLFIGSSTEALKIAHAIQANLDYDVEVVIWTHEVFGLSVNTIDALITALKSVDFGVFVFSPDDITNMRGKEHKAVRDNVLFELGLFIGHLDKERSFFLIPRGEKDLHLPTDLLGITSGNYDANRSDDNWQAATQVACSQILKRVEELGQKQRDAFTPQSAQKQPKIEEVRETHSVQDEKSENSENNSDLDIFNAHFDKDSEKGLSIIEKRLETVTDDDDKVYYESLKAFFKEENLEEAIGFLENLITDNPKHPSPYITASLIYQEDELFDEAMQILDSALLSVEDEDKELIKYNKAIILIDVEQENEALKILKELIEVKTKIASVYTKAAKIFKNQENTEEAEEIYKKGLKLLPKNKDILFSYASFLDDKGENEAALIMFRKLTKLSPRNSDYWGRLGNIYLNLKLNGLALEAYEKANEVSENKEAWILGNIGNIYKNRGFYPKAIEYLKKSLEIDPDSDYSHERLATAIKSDTDEREEVDEIISKYKQEKTLKYLIQRNLKFRSTIHNK